MALQPDVMAATRNGALDILIVGGGPARMTAGLCLDVPMHGGMGIQKHADFFRDFRGDTVHPSTLELLRELGLLDEFLKRPHDEVRRLTGRVANERSSSPTWGTFPSRAASWP